MKLRDKIATTGDLMTSIRGRRLAAASAAGAMVVAGLGAVTPAAATHDCVSKHEFAVVKRGMTKDRVHQIFDVIGRQVYFYSDGATYRYEERSYRSCARPAASTLSVFYENGRLSSKYAYWG